MATAVIKTVLNIYRMKGTHDSLISSDKSPKLSKVGFFTKMCGGKMNSSSSGLKALQTVYTSGIIMKKPTTASNTKLQISPPRERAWRAREPCRSRLTLVSAIPYLPTLFSNF